MHVYLTETGETHAMHAWVHGLFDHKYCHWNFGPEKFGPGRKFSLKILVRPDR